MLYGGRIVQVTILNFISYFKLNYINFYCIHHLDIFFSRSSLNRKHPEFNTFIITQNIKFTSRKKNLYLLWKAFYINSVTDIDGVDTNDIENL